MRWQSHSRGKWDKARACVGGRGSLTLGRGVAGRSARRALPNPGGRCPGIRTRPLSPPLFSQNETVVAPGTIFGSMARPQRKKAIPFSVRSQLFLHQGEKPEFATVTYAVTKPPAEQQRGPRLGVCPPRNYHVGMYVAVAVYFRCKWSICGRDEG